VIYTPANFTLDTQLLIVLDGQDYLERAKITRIVDYLIENQIMQPIIMVMIESKSNSRTVEYTCSESNLLFINYVVIPYVEKITGIIPIQERPGDYGILGASFGGLFAIFAGLRNPAIYGKVISQSGAFTIDQHPFVVWNLLDQKETVTFDAYMDVGKYEWLVETNIEFFNQIKICPIS
jgi:enterochelin esterase family protein